MMDEQWLLILAAAMFGAGLGFVLGVWFCSRRVTETVARTLRDLDGARWNLRERGRRHE